MSERMTFNQLNEQVSSAYVNETDDLPTILIPSQGNIFTAQYDKNTGTAHFEDGLKSKEVKNISAVSDESQEALAAILAGESLRSAEQSRFDAMLDLDKFGHENKGLTQQQIIDKARVDLTPEKKSKRQLISDRRVADARDAAMKAYKRPEMN